MNTRFPAFVTVDMRGLKPALVTRARAQRTTVSALVREAIARELGLADAPTEARGEAPASASTPALLKVSIRLTRDEADQLRAGARRAGLSRGALLAGLLSNVPSQSDASASRVDCLAELTASTAELATLSRSINHLTSLLRRGEVAPAQQYRRMLDTLGDDVRAHLALAAGVLATLRPARSSAERAKPMRRAAS